MSKICCVSGCPNGKTLAEGKKQVTFHKWVQQYFGLNGILDAFCTCYSVHVEIQSDSIRNIPENILQLLDALKPQRVGLSGPLNFGMGGKNPKSTLIWSSSFPLICPPLLERPIVPGEIPSSVIWPYPLKQTATANYAYQHNIFMTYSTVCHQGYSVLIKANPA